MSAKSLSEMRLVIEVLRCGHLLMRELTKDTDPIDTSYLAAVRR